MDPFLGFQNKTLAPKTLPEAGDGAVPKTGSVNHLEKEPWLAMLRLTVQTVTPPCCHCPANFLMDQDHSALEPPLPPTPEASPVPCQLKLSHCISWMMVYCQTCKFKCCSKFHRPQASEKNRITARYHVPCHAMPMQSCKLLSNLCTHCHSAKIQNL